MSRDLLAGLLAPLGCTLIGSGAIFGKLTPSALMRYDIAQTRMTKGDVTVDASCNDLLIVSKLKSY
jgi:hypothetical protein